MSIIKHNLLPKQKSRKYHLDVEIDLYPYASELYYELNSFGIIQRMKEIPQLGVIKVPQKLEKSRYDYVMLQLYLHQLIKNNLQSQLRLTYNNPVKSYEFRPDYHYNTKEDKPTIGDVLQLLTIVYNIGHFYNTFTSSRAVTMMAAEDDTFKKMIVSASTDNKYTPVVNKLLTDNDYQHFHLLNSLLILEHCDQAKQSVILAKEILYAYINEKSLPTESKLAYAFSIFRNVRTVSYMAYDLQIANTPLTIDLCNQAAVLVLLRELLSEYNNNISSSRLIESISKLLDDTVYNENSNAICYYKISRKIVSFLQRKEHFEGRKYYDDFFLNRTSLLNCSYSHNRDYVQEAILKTTFQRSERHISEYTFFSLERINNTRVGYYDRHTGEQTILVSLKNHCASKTVAALHVLRTLVDALRKIKDIAPNDIRFLLCVKFFLFYLFNENPVLIKPTIDEHTCVLCTRGKNSRITEVKKLLNNGCGSPDQNHEAAFMVNCLEQDKLNDTTICVPASIVVYQKDAVGRKLCEFDGIVIHPLRKQKQVLFLEAKNTADKPSLAKNCLIGKLDKLSFSYSATDIQTVNYDAELEVTI